MGVFLRYVLLALAFTLLSSGAVIAAFLDVCDSVGYRIMWLILPMDLLFMTAVVINDRVAVPRLLLRGRYGAYCGVSAAMSYGLSVISLLAENMVRGALGIAPRVADFGNPWVYVNSASNCVLLWIVLLGLGWWHLYHRWQDEIKAERHLTDMLNRYMTEVRSRLNPQVILDSLSLISSTLRRSVRNTAVEIRKLSSWLRTQLYELPSPPRLDENRSMESDSKALAGFIAGRRYRALRHVLFQSVLIAISAGTLFVTPDSPELTPQRVAGSLFMLVVLDILAYFNICCLFPRFRKNRDMRKYFRSVGLLLAAVVVPLIVMQIVTFDDVVADSGLPLLMGVLSAAGSVMTLFFFIGGTSMVLMLQDWLSGQRRIALLRAETARQEYAFLKKQINPHFLFNVLNNVSILSVDEPEEAEEMLAGLRGLLEYQFAETRHDTTTVGREAAFLGSYLRLEATRTDGLEYDISCAGSVDAAEVPTLVFIVFVENAVKYSSMISGCRRVSVSFSREAGCIVFRCANTFREGEIAEVHNGGLGLENTRRRLRLLYDDAFTLSAVADGEYYRITLKLPCDGLHNS